MPKVIADITMSLDGYVTGPGADEQHGLGDAPELHTWVMDRDAVDTESSNGPRRRVVPSSWAGGCSIPSTALMVGTRTWGTARSRPRRRRSSSSPTRRPGRSPRTGARDAIHLP